VLNRLIAREPAPLIGLDVSSSVTGLDLKLSPATLTISEGYGQPISFLVGGGAPPYRAVLDDLTEVVVASIGSDAVVLTGVGGQYCLSNSGNKTVTMTLLDSQGNSVTSTLVINNDGSC
jgi:hypothetical protein